MDQLSADPVYYSTLGDEDDEFGKLSGEESEGVSDDQDKDDSDDDAALSLKDRYVRPRFDHWMAATSAVGPKRELLLELYSRLEVAARDDELLSSVHGLRVEFQIAGMQGKYEQLCLSDSSQTWQLVDRKLELVPNVAVKLELDAEPLISCRYFVGQTASSSSSVDEERLSERFGSNTLEQLGGVHVLLQFLGVICADPGTPSSYVQFLPFGGLPLASIRVCVSDDSPTARDNAVAGVDVKAAKKPPFKPALRGPSPSAPKPKPKPPDEANKASSARPKPKARGSSQSRPKCSASGQVVLSLFAFSCDLILRMDEKQLRIMRDSFNTQIEFSFLSECRPGGVSTLTDFTSGRDQHRTEHALECGDERPPLDSVTAVSVRKVPFALLFARFLVAEELWGADGVLYLKLADDRGSSLSARRDADARRHRETKLVTSHWSLELLRQWGLAVLGCKRSGAAYPQFGTNRRNLLTALGLRNLSSLAGSLSSTYRDTVCYYSLKECPAVRGVVALTIDDGLCRQGPGKAVVAEVLDALRQHQAKATFFVCSEYLKGFEEEAGQLLREGCELANHCPED
ncbi:unnamed protein product, partial [Polarella glacialis]